MKIIRNESVKQMSLAFYETFIEVNKLSKEHCEQGRKFMEFRVSQKISPIEAAEMLECRQEVLMALESGAYWFDGVGNLEVLLKVANCYEIESRRSVNKLKKIIEELLSKKMFGEVNIIISVVNLKKIGIVTAITLLAATLTSKSDLSARSRFFERVKSELNDRGYAEGQIASYLMELE